MRKILAIDGGGAKGTIPMTMLKNMEEKLGKPIHEEFDIIIGVSVGAIIGGMLSTGLISAEYLSTKFIGALPIIFDRRLRIPILEPKYDRKDVQNIMAEVIPSGKTMREACKTKFICNSINMVDGRPHYFKSWENKDGALKLCEAIDRSYAAPLYFGTVVDKETQSVWMDGGCGGENSPIMESLIEVCRQGWIKERVHILSLGCGSSNCSIPFNKAKNYKNIRQVKYYMNPVDGGLSRVQSSLLQATWMDTIDEALTNVTFQRVTKMGLDKKMDKMDAIEFTKEYMRIGEELSNDIDYTLLKE